MNSFSEFLDMGGYAAFVWPAYGLAAVIMLILAATSWRALVAERATLEKLESTQSGRRRPADEASDGR